MSQENVEKARRGYEAWLRGDVDAGSEDFAPDFELDMSRAIGTDRGIYSLNQARRLMEEFQQALEVVQVGAEYIDAGEHVVITWTNRVRGRDGIEVQARGTWLCTIRDGWVVRICLYQDVQEALEAAGLREQGMSQENVEVVREAHEAFNLRDLDALADLTGPDWVMDWSRSIGPQRGVYQGRSGVEEWIAAISEAFESFEILPLEYVSAGDRIVVPTRVKGRGRGSGVVVDAEGVTLWELERGKVVRLTLYGARQEALEAAGLSE